MVLVVVTAGCSRSFYRGRADAEVKELIDCNLANPGTGPLADFTIDIDPRSRMYSPYSPDWPPMPPDDATSHILMECVDGKRGRADMASLRRHAATRPIHAGSSTCRLTSKGSWCSTATRRYRWPCCSRPTTSGRLETLYLSALDVSFERFRFDTQFFGGSAVNYTTAAAITRGPVGRCSRCRHSIHSIGSAPSGLFATGGELVVGLANSFVWEFAGPDDHRVSSVLDFALVQPPVARGGACASAGAAHSQ